MAEVSRTVLKSYFELNDRPTQAQFVDLIDSLHNITDDGEAAVTGGNSYTGDQDYGGNQVEGYRSKVVTGVSGTLTAESHSGNIIKTSGNITVPTTAGFICTIIAGGAHTVSFNSTTSAAMTTGDVMTVIVESGTVIHASLLPVAAKVAFS